MKLSEFVTQIADFEPDWNTHTNSDLEAYLRGFWALVRQYNPKTLPTDEIVVRWFQKAWTIDPILFDDSWLNLLKNESANSILNWRNDFNYFRDTLLYQIADLHQIREANIEELPMTSVRSPAGNIWANLSIGNFLEAATRGLQDGVADDVELGSMPWSELVHMLQLGRLYE